MKKIVLFSVTALSLFVSSSAVRSDEPQDAAPPSVFLIGNSLTWDTVPSLLDGDRQWHVDCGKSLPFMVANPDMPCVKTSTLWPNALKDKQYGVIVLQVHYGSTMEEDVAAITNLIRRQADARVIIHTGWARSASRADEWSSDDGAPTAKMSHNRAWFDALLATLRRKHPHREFTRTRAMDALQQVAEDVAAGNAPIDSVTELYRDKIHMDLVTGRYLMHNIMRHALGQPRSSGGFRKPSDKTEKLSPEMKDWLDSILDRVLHQ